MLFHDRRDRRAFERHVDRQHLVEDDAEAVDVCARVWLFVGPLLRGHVERRSHQAAGLCLNKGSEQVAGLDLCQTKIEDL